MNTPEFAVRIQHGLVTHWQNEPLTTYVKAEECLRAIQELTGERGEIEEVLLFVAPEQTGTGEGG